MILAVLCVYHAAMSNATCFGELITACRFSNSQRMSVQCQGRLLTGRHHRDRATRQSQTSLLGTLQQHLSLPESSQLLQQSNISSLKM